MGYEKASPKRLALLFATITLLAIAGELSPGCGNLHPVQPDESAPRRRCNEWKMAARFGHFDAETT